MNAEDRERLRLYREWLRTSAPGLYDVEGALKRLDDPDLDEWGLPLES